MILEPIKKEQVLSPQYKQTVLPPIYADTSNIQKSISEQYGKTVVLPEKHSVEVKNFIETPQGLVLQSSNIVSQPNLTTNINNQSINQSIHQSINKSIHQSINQSINQPNILQYVNSLILNQNSQVYRQPVTGYDPGKVEPTI